ncbi:hypothetical protein Emed_006807 [Eimeria media]
MEPLLRQVVFASTHANVLCFAACPATAEIPLEVRKKTFKSDDIRALGLLLTTARTLISKATMRSAFLVLSSYYRIYSLFRACAAAYGLGFLFSRVDQVAGSSLLTLLHSSPSPAGPLVRRFRYYANKQTPSLSRKAEILFIGVQQLVTSVSLFYVSGLANLLVTTLSSLFQDRLKHNLYAGLISGLRLSDVTSSSLAGFVKEDLAVLDKYRDSTVLASIKNSMNLVSELVLHPVKLGNLIDKLRTPNSSYWTLVESLRSIAVPILRGESAQKWDTIVNFHIHPLLETISVKAQELAISSMGSWMFKLPNLLEWSDRGLDYRALLATHWDPLVGAFSNWEAKEELYTKQGLHWREAARMKQMYLLFLQQAYRLSFLQEDSQHPLLRPGTASCMSQFVARLEASGSPRLKAILDYVRLPKAFFTWELVNYCFLKMQDENCANLPVYFSSVSDEAVPVEFVLRTPPKEDAIRILQSFPKVVRPARTAFGYATKTKFASSSKTGLVERVRGNLIARVKKSHGPKLIMEVRGFAADPNYLTLVLKYKRQKVELVAKPLHLLETIDPVNCKARLSLGGRTNSFGEAAKSAESKGPPGTSAPVHEVKITYPAERFDSRTHQILSHALQLLIPDDVLEEMLRSFSQGSSSYIWRLNGKDKAVEFLRQWYLAKKLLSSAYTETVNLEVSQNISGFHGRQRKYLENLLRQSGVDGKPFRDSWILYLNHAHAGNPMSWDVLDVEAQSKADQLLRRYSADFGELAALAFATEQELERVAGLDHVLKRMQRRLFDYSHMRTLYIESPGAFLQHLLSRESSDEVPQFDNWLQQRLQGNLMHKDCKPDSFYGSAYAQYTALVEYYDKKDINAPVPAADEIKRFLLVASMYRAQCAELFFLAASLFVNSPFLMQSNLDRIMRKQTHECTSVLEHKRLFCVMLVDLPDAGLPKGHLVRIRHEDDPHHGGLYQLIERLDLCSFLLQDANGLQVATDAPLHVVRSKSCRFSAALAFAAAPLHKCAAKHSMPNGKAPRPVPLGLCVMTAGFEDGDQVAHSSVQRQRFEFTSKDESTGVCTLKDNKGYLFHLRPDDPSPITIGRFSQHDKRLMSGTWTLADPPFVYNTLMDSTPDLTVDFEVQHNIVQDCYSGLACVIRDDRDLPISVKYATPDEKAFAWAGPWLWLFLNGLHSEYLSNVADMQLVRSREDGFWIQRTADELSDLCWYLRDEPALSLNRDCLKPTSPGLVSRVFRRFKRNGGNDKSVPDRCSVRVDAFKDFFPGAPNLNAIPPDSPSIVFGQQTEQMVKCMAFAAYVLRKEREDSAQFGLKQHFRQRKIGQSASPSWWLKAKELKEMIKRLSASGQKPTSPQQDWFELIKLTSDTPLERYWIARICSLEPNFRKLFSSLRLPEEQHDSVPCAEVSALIILASIMSEITLVVRRRFLVKEKTRSAHLRRLLSFLDTNDVPTPCNKPEGSQSPSVPPDASATPEAAECKNREAAVNLFLHMKAQKDAVHVQTDDLIQLIRAKFTPVLYSRLSPGFISNEKHEGRRQAARFRAMDEEVNDLYAALHRPFDVWQGTFQQRQRHEFLEIRMQQQCPFRHPQPTQHAKEVVPDSEDKRPLQERAADRQKQTTLMFTGLFLMQIMARGSAFANSVVELVLDEQRFNQALSETTWPLLEYLQHQSIPISNDPEAVVEGLLKDLNFAEISSFLPPPLEGLDAFAFPVGFLRLQSKGRSYSTLVTPSGDAIFGNIQSVVDENPHDTRILVKIKKDGGSLHLENTASNTFYDFTEPTDCNPGSTLSTEVLRSAWLEKEADVDSGSFWDKAFGSWKDAATHYVDAALQRQDPSGLCQGQRDFLVEELLNAISHKEKIRVGDYVQVTAPVSGVVYELLQIQPISRTGCVAKLRQLNTGEISLSRSPLIRVPAPSSTCHGANLGLLVSFTLGELVRKPSSIEVYEYQGTCGSLYEIKNYVTGAVEWTNEDLIPLWAPFHREFPDSATGQISKAILYENRLPDILVLLKEFCKTEASQISRSDFRMVLRLLVSHQKLPESNLKSLHTTFDKRANKTQFYDTMGMVQQLASDLLTSLEGQLGVSSSQASDKELLHAWGSASLGALEAMWRSRQLWRMLYKIHQEGFALFFAEVANLPQRPDVRATEILSNMAEVKRQGVQAILNFDPDSGTPLVLPAPSAAVPRRAATPQQTSEEGTDVDTAPWLSHFIDFIGESVLPTKKALRAWEDYITAIEVQVQAFSTQQKALDEYREALQNRDSVFPQSSLAAVWSDSVLLQLWEKIGGLMERELGNKIPPSVIKQTIKPVIFQELVEVSALTFKDDIDKEKVFEKLSEFLAEEVSKVYHIQNPGRPPRADVLLDIVTLLQVERQDLKRLASKAIKEKRMRDQYHLLARKYVAEVVSDELIGIDGVLDMIGALESMLSSMMTPLIDRALGLVTKITKIFSKTRHRKRHFLFAFDALAAALEKLPAQETPPCKFEPLVHHQLPYTDEELEEEAPPLEEEMKVPRRPMKAMTSLKRISLKWITKGAGALSRAGFRLMNWFADIPFPDQMVNLPLIFWRQISKGALASGLQAALLTFVGPGSKKYIKMLQDSMWESGVQPWVDSMKEQGETLARLHRRISLHQGLDRHWWKELPLLIFLKQSLDDARLSVFAPGVLHMIWTQIKLVTSASSGLYKVLMAPVQGLGAYLYLLLIELLHNLLPAENGDFLVPGQFQEKDNGSRVMDIAVANPPDLIRYLHRFFDIIVKVYVPMVRDLFNTIVQIVFQKLAYRIGSANGPLEFWRIMNHIAGYDVDGELEDTMRELIFRIGDDLVRFWPGMPVGEPGQWQG